jgi:small subunit ribosomal protein S2
MAVVTMRQLLEAGVHFGHQTRRWNPKMKRFIFGERNGIYIIDLNQTLERIDVAYSFVRDLVADNGTILFVGTKKQTQDPIARYAIQCGMPYINERWLGGMLTNFNTIAGRVKKMQEYERMRAAGDFDAMPKKEALILTRELDKLQRNLGGIRNMTRLPEAVFIIDTKKEHIAVTEANKLGLPIVAVVDTNCDPDLITYVIPGNDDAIRAGTLMCRVIADAVEEGRFIASRRAARSGTPAAAGPPVIDPEEEARRAEQQRDARRQAALAQAEREARLAAMRRAAAEAPQSPDGGATGAGAGATGGARQAGSAAQSGLAAGVEAPPAPRSTADTERAAGAQNVEGAAPSQTASLEAIPDEPGAQTTTTQE